MYKLTTLGNFKIAEALKNVAQFCLTEGDAFDGGGRLDDFKLSCKSSDLSFLS